MKIVSFVPIKLNNERLANKNILPFGKGKPLISSILNTLLSVDKLDGIYVYCSQPEIQNYLEEGITYLKRPSSLDLSSTKINEVIKSFVEEVSADIYVLTHATAPFISKNSFDKGIEAVLSGKYDSAFSVQRVQNFIWDSKGPINFDLDQIARTQDLPPYYFETSGMYIFTKDLVLKHNRRVGFNPYMLEVSKVESIDIDDIDDFNIANAIANLM